MPKITVLIPIRIEIDYQDGTPVELFQDDLAESMKEKVESFAHQATVDVLVRAHGYDQMTLWSCRIDE